MELLLDIFLDAFKDSIILLPFLFVTYLLIELIEHKAGEHTSKLIAGSHRAGPILGALLGVIPQCGFSAIASEFYTHRVITMGTLMSIYLSTSDEMLPILVAERVNPGIIFKVLGMKVLIGMLFGFIIDAAMRNKPELKHHCKIHEGEEGGNILIDALKHTLQVFLFIFLVTLAIGACIAIIGEDKLSGFVLNQPVLGEFLAALIGLIPNCAGSVIITQLFLNGAIGTGAVMSGLLVSAGIGPLMLFRTNNNRKENIFIIILLYCISVGSGLIISLLNIQL